MIMTGKRAIVTGAGGGIGHQIACDLALLGCHVVALDIKSPPDDFPKQPGHVSYVKIDLCDVSAINAAIADAAGDVGLDYVVNAAGVALWEKDGSLVDIDLDVLDLTMNINFMAPVHIVRCSVPHMRKRGGGAFVHISSIVGIRTMDNALTHGAMDAYQISKAALISMSRALALQEGIHNIRSNTVCPGSIWTPMTNEIYKDSNRVDTMAKRTPLQKVGTPKDVSEACLYLLSDRSKFITGTDLIIDGGLIQKVG